MIDNIVNQHIETIKNFFSDENEKKLKDLVSLAKSRVNAGNKFIAVGNGGSCSDALHFVAELVGRYNRDRPPIPAVALLSNPASVSAISNDYSYETAAIREFDAIYRPGDILVLITTSGTSKNIINLLDHAIENNRGCTTVLLTSTKCPKDIPADYKFEVPSTTVARIQEAHIVFLHALAQMLEEDND